MVETIRTSVIDIKNCSRTFKPSEKTLSKIRKMCAQTTENSIPDRTKMREGFYNIVNDGHLKKPNWLASLLHRIFKKNSN